jgi:nitrile hydratase beta subunit
MDGIHDIGGKLGYGPVDVNEPDEPFHAEFEGREWGMSRTARTSGITIDWWRHVRELIGTEDYLNRPYFDSWAQTDMAAMINAGMFTYAELESGISETAPLGQIDPMDYDAVLQHNATMGRKFEHPVDEPAKYAVGQTVVTNALGHDGHTRLPEYARGKVGIILSHHGGHMFPDDCAKGIETAQHLYTVSFKARELWGVAANPHDSVSLDLWESYLNAK